jgi:very-short-patch-repair endonuclease
MGFLGGELVRFTTEELQSALDQKTGGVVFIDGPVSGYSKPVQLKDVEYGVYFLAPKEILNPNKSCRCKARFLVEKGVCRTAEDVQKKLDQLFDYGLKIDPETFVSTHAKARFVDPEFGEFWQKPNNTLSLKQGHPERGKRNREKTNLEKYGVANQNRRPEFKAVMAEKKEEIREKQRSTFFEKYGCYGSGGLEKEKQKNLKKWYERGSKKIIFCPEEGIYKRKAEKGVRSFPGLKKFASENDIPYSTAHSYMAYKGCTTFEEILERWRSDYVKRTSNLEQVVLDFCPSFKKNQESVSGVFPDVIVGEDIFVECDGLYWHSEKMKKKRFHLDRREKLESEGKKILFFRQDEILNKPDIVRSMIFSRIGKGQRRVYARSCSFETSFDRDQFFETNHIMGTRRGARRIGLGQNGEIVCAMLYSISGDVLKIERFCNAQNTTVVGGLSKILKKLQKIHPEIKTVCSWVDRRYGDGHSLETLGFRQVRTVLGWKWTDFSKTFNRSFCTANMDERRLSEAEHAEEKGLVKIYDAGQTLFELKLENTYTV